MSTPSPQLPLGQVIGSRYRVQSLIGRGGMGMVYSATHELTGRRVALKLMLGDSDDAPVLHDRFLSEARIAAAVRHPNIVDVLDMGLHGGAPFLVMELLEGRSLEQVLQSQQRLSVEQALVWMFPIIGALAVLHDAGIVHRDVKPSNIFMSSLPRHPLRPKLLDFGLARVVSDLRLTRSGTVIGTPLYMAPEHAAGLATGPQADVWSIGVVLYESLSGQSPFNYVDRSSLALQVLAGLVRPLGEAQPDLPEPICNVVNRALQRDLTRRYPDMRSLAEALHAAARASNIALPADPDPIGLPDYASWQTGLRHGGTTEEHLTPRAAAALAGTPSSQAPASRQRDSAGTRGVAPGAASRLRIRSVLGVLGVLVLLTLALWWQRSRPQPGPVATPVPVESTSTSSPSNAGSSDSQQAPVRSYQPTVESLVEPKAVSQPDKAAAPARTSDGALRPQGKRRPNAERPAPHRAPPERGATNHPAATPDEVESEWK